MCSQSRPGRLIHIADKPLADVLIKISSVTLHTNIPEPAINPAQEAEEVPGFFPEPQPFFPAWLLNITLAQKTERNDML